MGATWTIALLFVVAVSICAISVVTAKTQHDYTCANHGGAVNLGQTITISVGQKMPLDGAPLQVVCKDGYRL